MKVIAIHVLITVITMLAQGAMAREVKFDKKVDVGALQAQLIKAGFKISYIECSANRCRITMPDSETKDPMPEVRKYNFVDPRELSASKITTLQGLYDKWEAGTISTEEKDQLIKGAVGAILGR